MDEDIGDEVLAYLNDIIELLRKKDVKELYELYELGYRNQIIGKCNSISRFELPIVLPSELLLRF